MHVLEPVRDPLGVTILTPCSIGAVTSGYRIPRLLGPLYMFLTDVHLIPPLSELRYLETVSGSRLDYLTDLC